MREQEEIVSNKLLAFLVLYPKEKLTLKVRNQVILTK